MESLAEHSRKLAVDGPRSAVAIRLALVVKTALVLGVVAMAEEQGPVLLVALAPLAPLAAEALRHLAGLDATEER